MDTNFQPLLIEALVQPAFYPHAVSTISRIETHISTVFLTGEYVYKIKKPVDFGFVDFKSLENRRYFCEQEVRLNRRLARGIYLAVVAFCWDGQKLTLDGSGRAIEYAVQMKQLSRKHTMQHLLNDNALTESDLMRLAAKLAQFHRKAPRVIDQPIWSYIKAACDENFRQVWPYRGKLLDTACLRAIQNATGELLDRSQGLFDQRTASGKICDGHGDLRAEHVYFTPDGQIQILDCIEFNERLRIVDVASDLAFLAMDLDYLHKPQFVHRFLKAYCRTAGDASMLCLMEFYKCYRAMVRCKVGCIQWSNPGLSIKQRDALSASVRRYLELAHDYARCMIKPALWIFCGLPASGKSALASALSKALQVEYLNSDRVRKQRFGLSPRDCAIEPVDQGIYSAEARQQVYAQLLDAARQRIQSGRSIILDATYSASTYREKVLQLADEYPAETLFVECTADEAVLRSRLRQREHAASVSDARLAHFDTLKSRFEPLTDIPPDRHIRIDTTAKMTDCLNSLFIERYLCRMEKCRQ